MHIPLSERNSGKYALILKTWLKDIMYGKDKHEWGFVVKELNPDV